MGSLRIVCMYLALVTIAACGINTIEEKEEGKINWSNQTMMTNNCSGDAQCAPYLKCVVGGTVGCLNGGCAGLNNSSVDFDCVKNTTEKNGTCGQVTPPQELLTHDASDAVCSFSEGKRANEDQYRAWLQVTADQPNSTVTIHSLSAYCVHQDGTVSPAGGTIKGEQTITWAGHYWRNTWYNPPNQVSVVPAGNTTYVVPNNPYLLHLGNGGSAAGCREIVLQATISTTGDAKVELGLDYYVGNTYGHESSVSGWKACISGKANLMTPRSDKLSCEGDLGASYNPPPPANNSCDGVPNGTTQSFGGGSLLGECRAGKRLCSNGTWTVLEQSYDGAAETCDGKDNDCDGTIDDGNVCATANNCPANGMRITPGPTLLNSCPSLITKTWGLGKQYTSAPGQPLIVTDNWSGYAYIETTCNGQEGSWPQGATNAQAGFAEICTQGMNVTTNTFVCWDKYSSKYRPTVPLSVSGAGSCP